MFEGLRGPVLGVPDVLFRYVFFDGPLGASSVDPRGFPLMGCDDICTSLHFFEGHLVVYLHFWCFQLFAFSIHLVEVLVVLFSGKAKVVLLFGRSDDTFV